MIWRSCARPSSLPYLHQHSNYSAWSFTATKALVLVLVRPASAVEHELLDALHHLRQLLHRSSAILLARARHRRRPLVREAIVQVVARTESSQVCVVCWGNCMQQHMELGHPWTTQKETRYKSWRRTPVTSDTVKLLTYRDWSRASRIPERKPDQGTCKYGGHNSDSENVPILLRITSGRICLRVAQFVGQCLQCIGSEIVFVKQNVVVCWPARSLPKVQNE